MRKPDRPKFGVIFRCAIYTRKSSDDGLEQEFNSLDAQREACEAYVTSQRHAGWIALTEMYDDGGLSGGTIERPALQRLLSDIKAGKVQIIVVYKVDRLTRSLADFAKIVDVLDAHDASFVSVTQQFNTTTSMGRLTLNMLLSFAQFEREIAGERIRDKIAASKAKGMWMGGNVPLGCDVRERKLVVSEAEASTVRMIFQRYAELGSVALLKAELERAGIVSKRREGADGELSGGKRFSRGALYLMLQNWLYRGNVAHKEKIYPGQHEAIIEPELWQAVQDRLAAGRREQSMAVGAEAPSLLSGLIFDSDGARLSPTHAVKKGKRYRYYVSTALITRSRSEHPKGRRIPAGDIEGLVLDRLRALFASGAEVSDAVAPLGLDAATQRAVLDRSSRFPGPMVSADSAPHLSPQPAFFLGGRGFKPGLGAACRPSGGRWTRCWPAWALRTTWANWSATRPRVRPRVSPEDQLTATGRSAQAPRAGRKTALEAVVNHPRRRGVPATDDER
jgi:site-specific DNA recombinase